MIRGARAAFPPALGVGLWLLPAPSGLPSDAWHYFALFAAVIVALIAEPLPGPVLGLLGITVAAALRLVAPTPDESLRWALSGFSHGTVWLVFAVFMFGLGYERTGLGRRIALVLVRGLGRRTLGLGYAVALADLLLSPFTPSNTARSGGMIFPFIRSIPGLYDSSPAGGPGRIGAYLMWTAFATTAVTSSMFLTANAANLLAAGFAREAVNVRIGWTEWAIGFLPAGLLLFALVPALAYVVYPPSVKVNDEVPAWAAEELTRMGPLSRREATMAAIAMVALSLWTFGEEWMSATTVALLCLCLMLLGGVLTWPDMVTHTDAWRVFVWFATLVTLADGLKRVGFLTWFASRTTAKLVGQGPIVTLAALVAVFFLAHYMFASLTAHAMALFPAFLAAGTAVPGMPARPLALALCYALGLMGVLTPYATGPAPIYFGAGYITRRQFWMLGLFFGATFLLVLLIVGLPWLLALGA